MGEAKEAYGAMIGDEAEQGEETGRAEKGRDGQRRKDNAGSGGLTDNLLGL